MSGDTYLIRADDIAAMPGTAKTHFLNGSAQRVNKSLGDAAGLADFGFHLIEVAPGHMTTEHHVHHHEDECVYVLSGTGTAHIGQYDHAIAAGDFIGYRKGGLAHSITNTGAEPLRCIVVGTRSAHDVADYPNLAKRIFRNAGLPWTIADHADLTYPAAGTGSK